MRARSVSLQKSPLEQFHISSSVAAPKGRVVHDDDSCLHAFGRQWQHGSDSETEGWCGSRSQGWDLELFGEDS